MVKGRGDMSRLKHFVLINSRIHINILIFINLLLASVAFLKDILLARYFGTSYHADSLYLAFFLPDTVGNNLLAAAIGISCIPIFTKAYKYGLHIEETIKKVILLTIIFSICFLLILIPSSEWLFTHFSKGNLLNEQKLTHSYFLILLPIVLLSPVSMIAASVLQVSGQFTKPAIMPVIFNFVLLIMISFCLIGNYPPSNGGYIYSSTLLFSTALVTLLSCFFVIKQMKKISFRIDFRFYSITSSNMDDVLFFLKVFTPYFCILISQQFIFLIERYYASTMEIGTISGLTYAYRISQFPIWVFIAAINTVLLPTIAKLIDDVNKTKLKKELAKSFYLVVSISLLVSIVFYFLGERLISILFLHGAFGQDSLNITSDIFKGYALSILGQSIFLVCLRYFIANGKMMIPLLTSVIGCLFHILLIVVLVSKMGAAGFGYAAAIGYTLTGVVLLFFLYKDIVISDKKAVEKIYE
jgi:putative peptidoglycan lipid II flippase